MNEPVVPMIEPIEQMLERLSVNAVFGAPTREGSVTVIPVAEVRLKVGYGYGYGFGPRKMAAGEEQQARETESGGGGSGGGGTGQAIPRGYIQIAEGGVTFQPIVDQARIAVAAIAMAAWIVFWISATIRASLKKGHR